MVRNYKSKTSKLWNDEQLKNAIKQCLQGKSVREVAKEFNIARETLRRHCNAAKADTVSANCGLESETTNKVTTQPESDIRIKRNFHFQPVFTEAQEHTVKEYLLICARLGHGLPTDRARRFAYTLAVKNNLKVPNAWHEQKCAGEDWMRGFLKRNPEVALRKAENCSLNRALCFNKTTVGEFYNNVEDVYLRYPDIVARKRIYNLDETATTNVQGKSKKVISPKGVKQVSQNTSAERGTLVTTCAIISAEGTVLPPAMVFPRVNFVPKMLTGCYPGTLGLVNPSGWMTADLFTDVMKHFVKWSNSSKDNQSILFFDNHESHISPEVISEAKNNGIHIITLPPHTSHKLQPLDKTVYGPFKRFYDDEINGWMLSNPGAVVSIYQIAGFVNKALVKAASPENILSGFRSTGIFPFNRNTYSDADFMQSDVTFIPENATSSDKAELPGNPELPEEIAELLGDPQFPDNPQLSEEPQGASEAMEPQPTATPRLPLMQISADNAETPRKASPSTSSPSEAGNNFIGPETLFGLPRRAKAKPKQTKRKRGRSMIATDTPEKTEIENAALRRRENASRKRAQGATKKNPKLKKPLFEKDEDEPTEVKRAAKKVKNTESRGKPQPKKRPVPRLTGEEEDDPGKASKKRRPCETPKKPQNRTRKAFNLSEEEREDDPPKKRKAGKRPSVP